MTDRYEGHDISVVKSCTGCDLYDTGGFCNHPMLTFSISIRTLAVEKPETLCPLRKKPLVISFGGKQ